jgi:hypothetical protein
MLDAVVRMGEQRAVTECEASRPPLDTPLDDLPPSVFAGSGMTLRHADRPARTLVMLAGGELDL